MEQRASFGYWLRRRRKALDLTQEVLAQQVGCAVATIRKIEADERRPSRVLAERLAEYLSIPPDQCAAFLKAARAELAADRLPASIDMLTDGDLQPQPPHNYILHEQIGSGGFSVVYRAVQPEVGREVAIKIILPRYANQATFIRRFESEAQTVARLEHPHIVPLYDYWREPGGAYLVMRYMPGGSLESTLRRGAWSIPQITHLLEQIGSALAFAHRRGVVHGDVKPANILLDQDSNTYLADFSIARDLLTISTIEPPQAGIEISSPSYLAPEQVSGAPITPWTDIYGLGVLLYTLLAGQLPCPELPRGERTHQQRYAPLPPLRARCPDLPPALDQVIQTATAYQMAERFPDVASMIVSWRQALATSGAGNGPSSAGATAEKDKLTYEGGPPAVLDAEIDNPYKGLRAFGEADVADFFGRATLVERLLNRMAEAEPAARFLAVVGPSGSGKSSAVRAGLVPALRGGRLPGSEHWFIVEMLPDGHPIEELKAALLRVAANPPPSSLVEQIQADVHGLARAVDHVLPDDPDTELVLVIDQLEELFTLTLNEASRAHFLQSLYTALVEPGSRLRVVITLRADFYDRPLNYAGFAELVRLRTEVLLPLNPQELEQAIVGPAARVGVAPAVDLITTILQEAGNQPGTLPLLQYALTELFDRRDGRTLTLEAYKASGGISGALAHRAEAIFTTLDEPAQQAARQIFLRLIALGEGAEDTRRRVLRSELSALINDTEQGQAEPGMGMRLAFQSPSLTVTRAQIIDRVIDAYGRARLLTFDRDPITRSPTVEVAHEALWREWGRLRSWLEASRADIRMQRTLNAEAAQWASAGRDSSYLLSGMRLAQLAGWANHSSLALTHNERALLDASVDQQRQSAAIEQARQRRELMIAQQLAEAEQHRADEQFRAAARLRRRALLLAGALLVALVAIVAVVALAWNNATLAQQNAVNAATAQASFIQSERLRLAAEATAAIERGASGELPRLLALHSLRYGYSPQADTALLEALTRGMIQRRFIGHTAAVNGVALAPDGKYGLTGSADFSARLWDVTTGAEIRQYTGHTGAINSVTFAPDGRSILTGSADRTARLWDRASGRELRRFVGHTDVVNDVAFSPDGRQILTASMDQTARLWDASSGHELRRLVGHSDAVTGVAFSPDGKRALTSSYDRTARLWDLATGQTLQVFEGHAGGLSSVAFAPDGRSMLTSSFDGTARVWDLASGRELKQLTGHTDALIGHAHFSPDGKQAVTASFDKTVRLWDIATSRELRRFAGHAAMVTDVAFSADGKLIFSGSADKSALLWYAHAEQEPRVFSDPTGGVTSVALAPGQSQLALAGGESGFAQLWNIGTGARLRSLGGQPGSISSVAFSTDGRLAVVSSSGVAIWDIATGQQVRALQGTARFSRAVFSPDGGQVLAGSDDTTAWQWDASTGQRLRALAEHTGAVADVAFSPDGTHALTGSADGTARLWEAASGRELCVFSGHTGAVTSVAFSPDGTYALTGSVDGTARLWNTSTGREVRVFSGHADAVTSVAFSPDGTYALTGSVDGTARLWNTSTGREQRRFAGHTSAITSVAYSADGRYVLTGSMDRTAQLWRANIQDVIQIACAQLPHDLSAEERATYNINDDMATCPKP
jgi:WD40 repeat protein/transcriptional regulator with XRE-family HTH domain